MPNKYSTFQFQPYRSVYVDSKRPEIAQHLRERHDQARQEYDILNRAIGSIDVPEMDKPVLEELKSRTEGRMRNVIESGAYEHGQMAINDAVTDFHSDRRIRDAAKSWENHLKDLEVQRELRAKGRFYDFNMRPETDEEGRVIRDEFGAPIMRRAIDMHNTEEMGVYQGASEGHLDFEQTAAQLMQQIQFDPVMLQKLSQATGVSPMDAELLLVHGKYIGEEKVNRIAEALTDMYMGTDAGNQRFRVLQTFNENPITGALYRPEEAREQLKRDLMSIGSKQVGGQYQYMVSPGGKYSLENQPTAPPSPNPGIIYDKVQISERMTPNSILGDNFENSAEYFNSDGTIKNRTGVKTGNVHPSGLPIPDSEAVEIPLETDIARFKEALEEVGGDRAKIKRDAGGGIERGYLAYIVDLYKEHRSKDTRVETEEDFIKKLAPALQEAVVTTGALRKLPTGGVKLAAQHVANNIDLVEVEIRSDEFLDNPTDVLIPFGEDMGVFERIARETDFSWDNADDVRTVILEGLSDISQGKPSPAVSLGTIDPLAEKPGAYRLIVNYKGKTFNLNVSTGEESRFFNTANQVGKLIRRGVPGEAVDLGDYGTVTTELRKTWGGFELVPVHRLTNGEIYNEGPSVYNSIVDASLRRLQATGLTEGDVLTNTKRIRERQ